jgi:micrococcal nuclease
MGRRTTSAVLLALALAVVGCTAGIQVDGTDATPPTTGTPGDGHLATVTTVVDGDTVEVRFANGSDDTVRLLGIDAPETRASNDPGEFDGVPDTTAGQACLERAGEAATAAVVDRIEGERVRIVVDPVADRRGSYGRLLAYVVHDGVDLNERLLREGHARVYDSTFSRSDAYDGAESAAQSAGRGLWTCRDGTVTTTATGTATADGSGLRLVGVNEDAAGPDGDNLGDEYLVFANPGSGSLNLGGWTVTDAAGHTYAVPEGVTLAPNGRLRLVTGEGTDGPATLFWGRSSPVWNNDGDTVTVRDASDALVLRESY